MTGFFDEDSPFLTHPLLTTERSASEVDRILAMCDGDPGDVLDIGCGFGRHAIEFANRGFDVVGIDPSSAMINAARSRAADAGVAIEFRDVAPTDFARHDGFDLVVCLFTSFGQIRPGATSDDADGLLTCAVESLRPDGTFVIEVPERDRTVDGLVLSEELGATSVARRFDERTSTVHEVFVTPSDTFDLCYRIYGRQELLEVLEGFELTIVETFDDALVKPPANFMTVFARRN